ncbi:MAG: hypothetical protein HYT49_02760 [Candidatus Wildermuthbacteria bacterium]|nr:hypothetical protein [Candidatus Wildermuthbacteria bacterium]
MAKKKKARLARLAAKRAQSRQAHLAARRPEKGLLVRRGKKPVAKAKRRAKKNPLASQRSGQAALPFFENVHRAKIKVIGIGGGGGNIAAEISSRVQRFDFVGANTDSQALKELSRKVKSFPFGQEFTGGLGCGMNAELGERAAKAEKDKIKRLLEGSDVCILLATLGGGTGSGATATFAEVAQELRILCIGIFTLPFSFEGERRAQIAQTALEKIKPLVNAYVVIPNENIFRVVEQKTPLKEALSAVNRRLAATLEGFMDTIALPGLINIDFADVRSTLEGRGRLAFINSAEASGITKAQEAVQAVLENRLYDYTIAGADRILFNMTGDRNIKMQEVAHVSSAISAYNPKARIIFGIACNSRTKDRLKVTLFAVGCDESGKQKEVLRKTQGKKRGKDKRENSPPKLNEEEEQQTEAPETSPSPPQESSRKDTLKREGRKGKVSEQEKSVRKPPAQKGRVRRSALDLKKAVDEELKELEKKERDWDIPAFLRNKP